MKTYTCDKCGLVLTSRKADNVIKIPHTEYSTATNSVTTYDHEVDLCDTCIIELRAWITGETLERIQE